MKTRAEIAAMSCDEVFDFAENLEAQRDAALAAQAAAESAKATAEADRDRYKAMVDQLGGAPAATTSQVDTLFTQQQEALFNNWRQGFEAVWTAPDPQAIFDAWGAGAAAKVQLSAMAVQMLEAANPGCTLPTLALMAGRTLTPHANGTVTVNPKL